jgi:hypothetical protein
MHSYQDEHGQLPPAVVYGEDGKPLYSWRVLLLPYIGEDELYHEFHLDEAWDSPHNIKLVSRMPMTYAPPPGKRSKVPPGHTVIHAFVGKGAAFEGRTGLRLPGDFPDGTANTILLIEAGKPVPWSSPEDLAYDPDGPLPDLQPIFRDGFRVAMADGSVIWFRKDINERTLREAIRRDDGDKIDPDW